MAARGPAQQQAPALRIGQVSACSGLSVKTIRYYCEQGLIAPIERSEAGYRLFDQSVLEELSLIKTLRLLDVPLIELQQILATRRAGICRCQQLKHALSTRISALDQRINELQTMQLELSQLLHSWQDCGGRDGGDPGTAHPLRPASAAAP